MRTSTFALILPLLVACGDDGNKTGADGTDTDVFEPVDTNPDKDTPGDTSGGNHPPELERIGDRSVAVGQTLSITLEAKDSDSDKLTYSVFGNLPDGARFDKGEHRFEWAPTEAGKTIFLTFVVSDGTDFDRETVRIQVTATATSNPPSFADVGDQTLPVGQPYTLTLVATDPDGDRLSYGHEGALPNGATLEEKTGVFNWTPSAADVGAPIRITFTVSDGTASDTLPVRFVVDDGGGTVGKPPVFTQIPAQTATVGQQLALTLGATDPNGDAVTFGIQGAAPPGASLAGANFTFTPDASLAGQTVQVTFTASDGALTSVMTVDISVRSGQTGTCQADPGEPNEDIASAKPQDIGHVTATLCETETSYDTDVYKIVIPAGRELKATLTFDANAGDLDLLLVDAGETFLASSDGVTSTEELKYSSAAEATVYLAVFGYGLEPLHLTYELELALGDAAAVCQDDGAYEDNDQPFEAKALDDAAQGATHQICADDADFWTIDVGCGAHVQVLMSIQGQADLDLYLYEDLAGDTLIESAVTEEPDETIDVPQAQSAGTWLLEVSGYPASAESPYELIADVSGACQDDGQAGPSRQNAKALANGGGPLEGLRICCSEDWFSFSLQAGEKVVADLAITGAGSLGGIAYGSDGTTQIAAKEPSPTGGQLSFTAAAAGTYYLKTSGVVGTTYKLTWTIEGATAEGCTPLSCGTYDVCNPDTHECQSDFCLGDEECPGGYVCRETYCVNECANADDCRAEYACKVFADQLSFCGVTGPSTSGDGCSDFASCEGGLACLFPESGGYCAAVGCALCPVDTQCATVGAVNFCAKTCQSNADCREAEGFTCSAEKVCLPQNP